MIIGIKNFSNTNTRSQNKKFVTDLATENILVTVLNIPVSNYVAKVTKIFWLPNRSRRERFLVVMKQAHESDYSC